MIFYKKYATFINYINEGLSSQDSCQRIFDEEGNFPSGDLRTQFVHLLQEASGIPSLESTLKTVLAEIG